MVFLCPEEHCEKEDSYHMLKHQEMARYEIGAIKLCLERYLSPQTLILETSGAPTLSVHVPV